MKFTLVIGQYALDRHFGLRAKATLTETVQVWRELSPKFFPLLCNETLPKRLTDVVFANAEQHHVVDCY
jgi:hypothetical protein